MRQPLRRRAGRRRRRAGRGAARRAPTAAATETATPPAPAETEHGTPTPFPSPVETVVEATPAPTQTATPQADPTAAPTQTPAQPQPQRAGARRGRARADAPPPAPPTPAADGDAAGHGPEARRRQDRAARTSRRTRTARRPTAGDCPERRRARRHGRWSLNLDLEGATRIEDRTTTAPTGPLGDDAPAPAFTPTGIPTPANPSYSLATPGPAPIGVPNFFIEKFRIPPFLLPIYQAAGIQYGIRWEVLAAINEIETDYGRNLNISSAGALGWMQFMPPTWDAYGVDANGDGQKDPFNPVDAIFAAARYLRAAGADEDLYRAIFAYNHADWYVESVLMRARVIGGLPADLVGSLTGLTQGRFPVAAKATYAGRAARLRARRSASSPARTPPTSSSPTARAARSASSAARARRSSPSTTASITRIGRNRKHGRFVELQDTYGNTYLYAGLGEVAETYPSPKERKARKRDLALPEGDVAPRRAASRSTRSDVGGAPGASRTVAPRKQAAAATPAKERLAASGDAAALPEALPAKERLFANPERPNAQPAGGDDQLAELTDEPMVLDGRRLDPDDYVRQAAEARRPHRRRHRARPARRPQRRRRRAAPALRDPPRRPRRAAHRPEADPRRLEAARVDGDLPLGQAQPVLRPRRRDALDRPDHAHEQGGAPAPRAAQPEHRRLRVRPQRHRAPARSTAACSPCSSSSPPPASSRR